MERRREEGEEEEVEVVVVLGRCGRFFLVLRPCLAASAAARSARAEDEREVGGLHTHARRLLRLVSSRAGFFWFWEAFLRVSPAFFFLFLLLPGCARGLAVVSCIRRRVSSSGRAREWTPTRWVFVAFLRFSFFFLASSSAARGVAFMFCFRLCVDFEDAELTALKSSSKVTSMYAVLYC